MGIKNIQGELRINDEVVATQDWVSNQLPKGEPSIIATFNITTKNTTIKLKNLDGMTAIDWGDGTIDNKLSHTYVENEKYECKIYDVTLIGVDAFRNCKQLISISISNDVQLIESGAFRGCDNLTKMSIPFCGKANDATKYEAPFGYIFGYVQLGNLLEGPVGTVNQYNYDASKYWYYVPSAIKEVSVTGTSISKNAFTNCTNLNSINISNNVVSIGSVAFASCAGLREIVIPDSVTSLGDYSTFSNCTSLQNISIPDSVTSIGSSAFENCSSLTSITIPDSATSIGNEAFENCDSLTSITIPDSVTSIGNSAFRGCSSLTSVTIGNGVTSIEGYAFSGCDNLISATFKNPTPITYNITYPWFKDNTSLTHIYVPYGCSEAYKTQWAADGATEDILNLIVESDREAMMSDVNAVKSSLEPLFFDYDTLTLEQCNEMVTAYQAGRTVFVRQKESITITDEESGESFEIMSNETLFEIKQYTDGIYNQDIETSYSVQYLVGDNITANMMYESCSREILLIVFDSDYFRKNIFSPPMDEFITFSANNLSSGKFGVYSTFDSMDTFINFNELSSEGGTVNVKGFFGRAEAVCKVSGKLFKVNGKLISPDEAYTDATYILNVGDIVEGVDGRYPITISEISEGEEPLPTVEELLARIVALESEIAELKA